MGDPEEERPSTSRKPPFLRPPFSSAPLDVVTPGADGDKQKTPLYGRKSVLGVLAAHVCLCVSGVGVSRLKVGVLFAIDLLHV